MKGPFAEPSSLVMKLMALLVAMVLLFVLVFAAVTFGYNTAYLLRVAGDLQAQALSAQRRAVSAIMDREFETFFSLAVDSGLRALVAGKEPLSPSVRIQRANTVIQGYISMQPDIIAVRIQSPDGTVFSYNRNSDIAGGTIKSRVWTQENQAALLDIEKRCRASRTLQVFADRRSIVTYGHMFHMGIQLRDFYSGEPCGLLIATFTTKPLATALSGEAGESTLARSALVSAQGDIIAHPDAQYIGQPLGEVGEADSRIEREVGRYGLRIVSVLDRERLLAKVHEYSRVMIGLVLVIMLCYIAQTTSLLRRSARTIRRLLRGIEAVEQGRLDVDVAPASRDEFGRITAAFNRMVTRLRETNAARERENAEKIRALDMQHKAEMEAMESQINSHFLANTINMISLTAIEAGNHEVSRLLKALSSCMRYTFENSGNPVPVRSEVHWLENYLMLQKQRCPHMFDYSILADEEILDEPIKKLLLQPFVENSIKHGFAGMESGGLLAVRLRRFGRGKIAVSVYDNGKGMPRAKAARIEALMRGGEDGGQVGIGISNVVLRVRRSYPGAKLHIRCSPGGGTRINLFLPPLGGTGRAGAGPGGGAG